jgi:hypothetical protein
LLLSRDGLVCEDHRAARPDLALRRIVLSCKSDCQSCSRRHIKRHAARAGLDPQQYAGHSLRSGFLTSVAARGASLFWMADQSRHKTLEVLRGYVRTAELFKDHPGNGLL